MIWIYIALNSTPNIDCYWVGADPRFRLYGLILSKQSVGPERGLFVGFWPMIAVWGLGFRVYPVSILCSVVFALAGIMSVNPIDPKPVKPPKPKTPNP